LVAADSAGDFMVVARSAEAVAFPVAVFDRLQRPRHERCLGHKHLR
jgi:hypothetical protein